MPTDRFDLCLARSGYSPEDVRDRTLHLISFARRPSINPMGQETGGRELGFDPDVLDAMEKAVTT